jgi:hypothetical protein
VRAEDVTLFLLEPTSNTAGPSVSILGVSALSVDEAGATHYVYSQLVSRKETYLTENPVTTETGGWISCFVSIRFSLLQIIHLLHTATFQADATRLLQEQTTSGPRDMVIKTKYECVRLENGTLTCHEEVAVLDKDGVTSTWLDDTRTGTPSPWWTIKNVETGLPSDDQGGAESTQQARARVCAVLASLAVGAALVLA